jgi:hypothetical protein
VAFDIRGSRIAAARAAGALSLGSFLMYAGAAIERVALDGTSAFLYALVGLAFAFGGAWSLLRFGARGAAPWLALVLLGLAPVAAFLGWMLVGEPGGAIETLLWLNLATGFLATVAIGVVLAGARAGGARVREGTRPAR